MESKLSIIQKIFLILTTVVLGVNTVFLIYKFPYPVAVYDLLIGFISLTVFILVGFILKRIQARKENQ